MKALSLRQPWAWAVMHAGKRIENRRWNTSFRGEFLIHAAKGMTKEEYDGAMWWMVNQKILEWKMGWPEPKELERGGIVGRARLIDVILPQTSESAIRSSRPHLDPRWHMKEQYGFVLDDVTPLPFKPCRGMLSFFELEEEETERREVTKDEAFRWKAAPISEWASRKAAVSFTEKDGRGTLRGIITLARVGTETYILDGGQAVSEYLLAFGCNVADAELRVKDFPSKEEMVNFFMTNIIGVGQLSLGGRK